MKLTTNRISNILLGISFVSLIGFSQQSIAQTKVGSTLAAQLNVKPNLPSKKLIEYGWDMPSPEYLRDNIRAMEEKPFDGVMFRLDNDGSNVFDLKAWDKAKLEPQINVLNAIKWHKFTDNFLMVYAASSMDWFSDADWKTVLAHARFISRAAKAAGCKGICFDPEPYGTNPWYYSAQKDVKEKSFGDYARKVRQRGQQFMKALSSEMPDLKLFMFYQYSMPYTFSGHDTDPVKRAQSLANSTYGLLNPFLDGVLEAASPQAKLIDGNEFSYYYKTPVQFFQAYQIMHQSTKQYVAPELRAKFDSNVEAAQALYVDYVFKLATPNKDISVETRKEQAHQFELNTYFALKTTDEYVWLYSERVNWWKNENMAPGLVDAVLSAREKIRNNQEFGLLTRTAHLQKLQPGQAPKIDGVLDDAVYSIIKPQDKFVGLYNANGAPLPLKASTQAWLTYDAQNLYIAIRNNDPEVDKLTVAGTARDSSVWGGDSDEISIQPDPRKSSFSHFILNPNNIQWDAIDDGMGNEDLSFNPHWQSATTKDENGWTLEAAIPWSELHLATPSPGASLRINLARMRPIGPELSSWSQFVNGFKEVNNFGELIFGEKHQ